MDSLVHIIEVSDLKQSEIIRHSKASVLKDVLDKSNEPGINKYDLEGYIYKLLEELDFFVLDGELQSLK